MEDFFFDAHFHPTLKKQFANSDEVGTLPVRNPWRTALRRDFLRGFRMLSIRKCLIKPLVESSLVSQSSLAQLRDSNYKLSVVVLFAPDKGLLELITKNQGFMDIVKSGKFGDLLVEAQFLSLVDTDAPFDILRKDLDLLQMSDTNGDTVVKLTKRDDFRLAPNDLPRVVFSVEGPHCLRSNMMETDEDKIINDINLNLAELSSKKARVIYVNLTHIDNCNSIFANQAYAVDGFRAGGFDEAHLRPVGDGLTAFGERLALELAKKGILSDVKHLSWKARRQFYAFSKVNLPNLPIICSHAGFTGCWFDKNGERISDYIISSETEGQQRRLKFAKPTKPTIGGVGFNASSINLYNEDIEAIFESGGLIGISLDQRVLGYSEVQRLGGEIVSDNVTSLSIGALDVDLVTDTEFVSLQELDMTSPLRNQLTMPSRLIECIQIEDITTDNSTDIEGFFHPRHFYLHVLHAMQIADGIGGMDAVKKMLTETLCIGSDFDGMIDGLDCCPDAGAIGAFKQRFVREFGDFLAEAGMSLPTGLTVAFVAERIFYKNGRDFVLKRLDAINAI